LKEASGLESAFEKVFEDRDTGAKDAGAGEVDGYGGRDPGGDQSGSAAGGAGQVDDDTGGAESGRVGGDAVPVFSE
jgi:hypothetical protein